MPARFGARRALLAGAATLLAPAVQGGTPTTNLALGFTPTVKIHPHTANVTYLGGTSNVTGYISGTTLTVTAVTGSPIAIGMYVSGSQGTASVQEGVRINSFGSGTGGAGTYNLSTDAASAVGSPGSPASFVCDGTKAVTSVQDTTGAYTVNFTAPMLPRMMTDARGVKFLRTHGYNTQTANSEAGTMALSGLDTHNFTLLVAMRNRSAKGVAVAKMVKGGYGMMTVGASYTHNIIAGPNSDNVNGAGIAGSGTVAGAANQTGLWAPTNLAVVGTGANSNDGYGGTDITNNYCHFYVQGRFKVGSKSAFQTRYTADASGIKLFGGPVDYYELILASSGQVTAANRATLVPQAGQAMMTNHGLVQFNNVVHVMGDSRTEENYGGSNLATLLTEPGASIVSSDTMVLNYAFSGGSISTMYGVLWAPGSPLDGQHMMPGTNRVLHWDGVNEIGNDGVIWPAPGTNGGTSFNTLDRADEVFNGANSTNNPINCTVSATITGTAGISTTLNIQSIVASGTGIQGGVLFDNSGNYAGHVSYQSPPLGIAVSSLAFPKAIAMAKPAPALVGTPATFTMKWGSVVDYASAILSRGFTFAITPDIGTSANAASERLRNHIRNDLLTAVNAGTGQTYDGKVKIVDVTQIQQGGVFIWGNGLVGANVFRDLTTHPTDAARLTLLNGADTPQYGWKQLAL